MSDSVEAFCQSCGMPLAEARSEDFGTNADGSRNEEYCALCFQKGAFLDPDITLDEMIETAARGWSNSDPAVSYEEALRVSRLNIPKLRRWH
ncbi:MAG TPA: zinc ribbon domain-containing protein [Dehalococcoidia bacterium]